MVIVGFGDHKHRQDDQSDQKVLSHNRGLGCAKSLDIAGHHGSFISGQGPLADGSFPTKEDMNNFQHAMVVMHWVAAIHWLAGKVIVD